ncbi:hypothetical protein E2C01_015411 [Portunus trituberculatus]|uniref:Uncharacterized protein n=1 Tax=Portunus trituberculatus TaxID=210409 RepID=A0A5B7DN43_PORTR|nr:hypothetical protein [Portunus trituberculatus]
MDLLVLPVSIGSGDKNEADCLTGIYWCLGNCQGVTRAGVDMREEQERHSKHVKSSVYTEGIVIITTGREEEEEEYKGIQRKPKQQQAFTSFKEEEQKQEQEQGKKEKEKRGRRELQERKRKSYNEGNDRKEKEKEEKEEEEEEEEEESVALHHLISKTLLHSTISTTTTTTTTTNTTTITTTTTANTANTTILPTPLPSTPPLPSQPGRQHYLLSTFFSPPPPSHLPSITTITNEEHHRRHHHSPHHRHRHPDSPWSSPPHYYRKQISVKSQPHQWRWTNRALERHRGTALHSPASRCSLPAVASRQLCDALLRFQANTMKEVLLLPITAIIIIKSPRRDYRVAFSYLYQEKGSRKKCAVVQTGDVKRARHKLHGVLVTTPSVTGGLREAYRRPPDPQHISFYTPSCSLLTLLRFIIHPASLPRFYLASHSSSPQCFLPFHQRPHPCLAPTHSTVNAPLGSVIHGREGVDGQHAPGRPQQARPSSPPASPRS